MKINEEVITQITNDVVGLLRSHQSSVDTAYLKHGDKFEVKFRSLLEPSKNSDGISIETEISFRPEPDVRDKTAKTTVGASQRVLAFVPRKIKRRPWAMAYGKEFRSGVMI